MALHTVTVSLASRNGDKLIAQFTSLKQAQEYRLLALVHPDVDFVTGPIDASVIHKNADVAMDALNFFSNA